MSKTVNPSITGWSRKFYDTLCVYWKAYKTPICMYPYKLVYGKACHLPVEQEHKPMWAIKRMNLDWKVASDKMLNEFKMLNKFFLKAYESSVIYKEKMKMYHDQRIEKREFAAGKFVLLFNSRFWLFPGKLISKCTGPFLIIKVYPHGAVELENKEGSKFTVNRKRIKIYLG